MNPRTSRVNSNSKKGSIEERVNRRKNQSKKGSIRKEDVDADKKVMAANRDKGFLQPV